MITFLFAGGKTEADLDSAFLHYSSKLNKIADSKIVFINSKEKTPEKIKKDESEKILNNLNKSSFVILFDETGKIGDSFEYAKVIQSSPFSDIIIIVGGSYGVSDQVKNQCHKAISFGKMVFPHQLARLMAIEQTYRGLLINKGSDYHHK